MRTVEDVYDAATLRRLQLVELDILKAFDALCAKYKLTYVALFGTALGAIRHNGIIPWDDDIDVGMPRCDYDKLPELVAEMGEDYYFLNGQVDPRYPFVTSRIMKRGTEFRMWSMRNSPIPSGIFLDIFCLDDLPDDTRKLRHQVLRCWLWEKLTVLRQQSQPNVPYRGLKRLAVHAACAVASVVLKPLSPVWLHRRTQRAAAEWSGYPSNTVGWPFGINPRDCIYPRAIIFPAGRHAFEDTTIAIPADTPAMLRQTFGESYMTPLPEGQRSYIVPYRLSFGDEMAAV